MQKERGSTVPYQGEKGESFRGELVFRRKKGPTGTGTLQNTPEPTRRTNTVRKLSSKTTSQEGGGERAWGHQSLKKGNEPKKKMAQALSRGRGERKAKRKRREDNQKNEQDCGGPGLRAKRRRKRKEQQKRARPWVPRYAGTGASGGKEGGTDRKRQMECT